jgi:hypothetical protein
VVRDRRGARPHSSCCQGRFVDNQFHGRKAPLPRRIHAVTHAHQFVAETVGKLAGAGFSGFQRLPDLEHLRAPSPHACYNAVLHREVDANGAETAQAHRLIGESRDFAFPR